MGENVIIKKKFDDTYFVGPREIFGYVKIDPNVTLGVFVENYLEEIERVIFNHDSIKESFEKYNAFTEEECLSLFKDRPDNLSAVINRINKFKSTLEKVIIDIVDGKTEIKLQLQENVFITGEKRVLGCLRMNPKIDCETFIKTKMDPIMRLVVRTQDIKDMFKTYPAFSEEDCIREFKDEPEKLEAVISRLEKFKK